MRKVLLACFGDTRDIERSLSGAASVDVISCPAGVDDLAALDTRYDVVLVAHADTAPIPIDVMIDWVNLNLAHRLTGGARPVWL